MPQGGSLMFLGDTHTHSLCSPDGHNTVLEMARAAHAAGLTHLCLTDHCDLITLQGKPSFTYDWAPYNAAMAEARAALPPGLDLAQGIELGEAYENPAAARAILAARPELDFVIGSVHNYRALRNKTDFYYADYPDRAACLETLEDYLGSLEALVALPDCYDTLGHVLYPLRYMNAALPQPLSLTEGDFLGLLTDILRRVAGDGKAMEVNTWRGRTVAEWAPMLRLFKSLGGELVTVGSDSHTTADVGKGVREAYALLKDCGFAYVAIYHGRKAGMEKLP